jgi:hypothetical protein
MKVRFHPLAERELISAALYLDNEAGLGADIAGASTGKLSQKVIQQGKMP